MNEFDYLNYINQNYPKDASRAEFVSGNAELLHAAIGLAEEAGEILGLIKKSIFYGRPWDDNKIREELGDTYHYLTRLAHLLHSSPSIMRETNVSKLKKRFPNGYSHEAAIAKADKTGTDK